VVGGDSDSPVAHAFDGAEETGVNQRAAGVGCWSEHGAAISRGGDGVIGQRLAGDGRRRDEGVQIKLACSPAGMGEGLLQAAVMRDEVDGGLDAGGEQTRVDGAGQNDPVFKVDSEIAHRLRDPGAALDRRDLDLKGGAVQRDAADEVPSISSGVGLDGVGRADHQSGGVDGPVLVGVCAGAERLWQRSGSNGSGRFGRVPAGES